MPLHLGAITNNSEKSSLLAAILQEKLDQANAVFVDPTRTYIHLSSDIHDLISNETIGKFVYTMKVGEKAIEILDIDIIWSNPIAADVHFLNLREGSSDSNEYYDAETVDTEQHFQLETVSRHIIGDAALEESNRKVYVSAFPFELTVFENIDALNLFFGFDHVIRIGDTDMQVGGLSETFLAPGSVLRGGEAQNESYSFVVGTVKVCREVLIELGNAKLGFVLAQVETGLGTIPVSMGRDVFDLKNLKAGCLIAMNADIKADLAAPGDYTVQAKNEEQ